MLHTLLPASERRALRKEYHIRAAIVAFFLLSVSVIVGLGALFPTYINVLFDQKSELAVAKSMTKEKDESGISEIEKEIVDLNNLLKVLDSGNYLRPSSFVSSIVGLRGENKITSIGLEQTSTTTMTFVLQGNAPTREGLLKFKASLENLATGNKVELPIAQLAKNTNISFSMKVTQTIK